MSVCLTQQVCYRHNAIHLLEGSWGYCTWLFWRRNESHWAYIWGLSPFKGNYWLLIVVKCKLNISWKNFCTDFWKIQLEDWVHEVWGQIWEARKNNGSYCWNRRRYRHLGRSFETIYSYWDSRWWKQVPMCQVRSNCPILRYFDVFLCYPLNFFLYISFGVISHFSFISGSRYFVCINVSIRCLMVVSFLGVKLGWLKFHWFVSLFLSILENTMLCPNPSHLSRSREKWLYQLHCTSSLLECSVVAQTVWNFCAFVVCLVMSRLLDSSACMPFSQHIFGLNFCCIFQM